MAIVMGLDQHRAQITAEWIDTDTGELGRARVSPALRGDVRRFLRPLRRSAARGGAGGDDRLAIRRRGTARGRCRRSFARRERLPRARLGCSCAASFCSATRSRAGRSPAWPITTVRWRAVGGALPRRSRSTCARSASSRSSCCARLRGARGRRSSGSSLRWEWPTCASSPRYTGRAPVRCSSACITSPTTSAP